ncbi:MAG: polysaccharide export protein [Acidobacteriia bacterium]|nr:polysaccharide export protein [Terriglobia bacterium]
MRSSRWMENWKPYGCTLIALVAMFVNVAMAQQQNAAATPQTPSSNFTADSQSSASVPALQQRNPRYRIQRGDTLALDFRFTPEYNESVTVQPDGFISLRGIGDIHAEGMTLPELNQALEASYSKSLHDPVITVTPQEFVKPFFSANGEVGKPGKYDLHGDTTVVQAIAIAGGFTSAAKHSQVVLFRQVSPDMVQAKVLNVKHMLNSHNLSEDMHLQPGDMLYVPKNALSKIMPYLSLNSVRATYAIQ